MNKYVDHMLTDLSFLCPDPTEVQRKALLPQAASPEADPKTRMSFIRKVIPGVPVEGGGREARKGRNITEPVNYSQLISRA